MDAKGGAAGTAPAADEDDEEEAFGRMAANWKEMGKWRGGGKKTKQPVKTHREDTDITACSHAVTHLQVNSPARLKKASWSI